MSRRETNSKAVVSLTVFIERWTEVSPMGLVVNIKNLLGWTTLGQRPAKLFVLRRLTTAVRIVNPVAARISDTEKVSTKCPT